MGPEGFSFPCLAKYIIIHLYISSDKYRNKIAEKQTGYNLAQMYKLFYEQKPHLFLSKQC